MYHRDNQSIVTHDVILEFHGCTHIFNESFAALLGFCADSARAIVYLADVQLFSHFLTDVGAKRAKQGLPEDVLFRALVRFAIDFHIARPFGDALALRLRRRRHRLLVSIDHST